MPESIYTLHYFTTEKTNICILFSPKIIDDKLFTGSYDGTLRVWDASDLEPEKHIGAPNETIRPKTKAKKVYDDNNIEIKAKSQKVMIENENYYSSSTKKHHSRNQPMPEYDDQDFYDKYTRRPTQSFNSRTLSEYDDN